MRILAVASQPLKQFFVPAKFGLPKPVNAFNQVLHGA